MKCVLTLTGALLLFSPNVEAEPETDYNLPELESVVSVESIHKYERPSTDDLNLLMQSLTAVPSQESELEEPTQIEPVESNYPWILYNIDTKEDGTIDFSQYEYGSCVILNKEGFFLSAYHAVKSFVEERKEGNNNNLILIYDPINGYAFSARSVIFSDETDIALGRIDADIELSIETVKIAENNESETGIVYSQFYNNIYHETLRKIFESGGEFYDNSDGTITYINLNAPILKDELGPTSTSGRFGGNPYESWEYAALMKTIPGNSGSGVFNLGTNTLGGINRSIVEDFKKKKHYADFVCKSLGINEEQLNSLEEDTLAFYTGTEAIRNMLTKYIISPLE
tara:strand:+ start:4097 stop:5119 length:1023 start_codon:yes stop_codon:yes gene_type:complete